MDRERAPFSLPGLQALCRRISTTLGQGRTVVVLTGPLSPEAARDAFLSETALRDWVSVPMLASDTETPEHVIEAALSIDVELLLAGASASCDEWQLGCVGALDEVENSTLVTWYATAARWAQAAQARRQRLPPLLLCHRGRESVPPPTPTLLLDVINAAQCITELDMQCFVRQRGASHLEPTQQWREAVIPPLARGDPRMVDRLWDVCLEDLEELLDCCALEPDRRLPATRALWRGEARLVLPIVDQIRLGVCQRFDDLLGPTWVEQWPPSDQEEATLVLQDSRHAQLGQLSVVARSARTLSHDRALREVLRCARRTRNELAHYRPITYADYLQLLQFSRDSDLEIGW